MTRRKPKQQPEQPKPPRKIALIGKAPDSMALAPYKDEQWEIWILNTLGFLNEVPRWDRQFELHDLELTKDKAYNGYYDWLKVQTKPLILRDAPPAEFAGGAQYPLQDIMQHFSQLAGRTYHTNTVSLMIALALYEHDMGATVGELGIYGINMAQHAKSQGVNAAGWFASEYARQRPSVEYWLGVADGRGITVTVPPQSDILKCSCIYGYHTTDAAKKLQARKAELEQRIGHAQAREQQSHDEAVYLSGALEGLNYDFQWVPGGNA
jgi:hypothetical protein